MSQPARVPINAPAMQEGTPHRPHAMRVAVLRYRNQASFCIVQKVTRKYVQVELFSNVLEGEHVSLHAGDGWSVVGTVAVCRKRDARIELHEPLDAETFMGISALNDPDRRRSVPRIEAAALVRLKLNGRTIAARLHNISATGARVSVGRPFQPGSPVMLTLPDYGDVCGSVCWSNLQETGLRFKAPMPVDALATWLNGRTRVSYRI